MYFQKEIWLLKTWIGPIILFYNEEPEGEHYEIGIFKIKDKEKGKKKYKFLQE